MNKTQRQLRKQTIWTAIAIIIVLALSTNILTQPENNAITTAREIDFVWIGLSKTVVMDDNPDFTSPVKLKDQMTIPPGEYYWKTAGISTKRKITIASEVSIELKQETNATLSIKNTGNVKTLIETLRDQDWSITAAVIVEPEQESNQDITEPSTILASQNE